MVESTLNLDQFSTPSDEPAHSGCASCGTGMATAALVKCGNGLEKVYPTTAVRYGFMRFVGEFTHQPDMKFTCGAKVVIQTRRGIEIGEQVSLTCTGCDKSVTRDQMKAWVKSSGDDTYMFSAGRILREATASDLGEYAHIQNSAKDRRDFARVLARRQNLALGIVECESLFGGERIIFFFTAAQRVDFRLMVKDLAKEYRTRIEMRQIGARDEARLLADYETCGREICCKVFLKTLRPVSMRMAKVQKATLDPSQVSGRCGRLKCCLRYEHTGYEELNKKLPRVGVNIHTNHGDGVIINRQILTQLVQVRTEDNEIITVVAEDIIATGVAPRPKAAPPREEKPRSKPTSRSRSDRPRGKRTRPPGDSPKDGKSPDKPQTGAKPAAGDAASAKSESGDASSDRPKRRRRRRRRKPKGPGDGSPPSSPGDGPPASPGDNSPA